MTTQVTEHRTLGEEIHRLRVAAGLSVAELSSRSGVRQAYLSAIESNHEEPSTAALQRIASHLDPSGAAYESLAPLLRAKILDATFVIATMIAGQPHVDDVKKFFRALRRAQRDIDLRPERYTRHYAKEFPHRFHSRMDTRRWGPGERLVFEPYTREVFEETVKWVGEHGIFDAGTAVCSYDRAVAQPCP